MRLLILGVRGGGGGVALLLGEFGLEGLTILESLLHVSKMDLKGSGKGLGLGPLALCI